jgi:hypothetical protein
VTVLPGPITYDFAGWPPPPLAFRPSFLRASEASLPPLRCQQPEALRRRAHALLVLIAQRADFRLQELAHLLDNAVELRGRVGRVESRGPRLDIAFRAAGAAPHAREFVNVTAFFVASNLFTRGSPAFELSQLPTVFTIGTEVLCSASAAWLNESRCPITVFKALTAFLLCPT